LWDPSDPSMKSPCKAVKEQLRPFACRAGRRLYWVPAVLFMLLIPWMTRVMVWKFNEPEVDPAILDEQEVQVARKKIQREIAVLDRKLAARKPGPCYLVINSASNEFSLYRGDKMIRKGKCSTGSYILLKNGEEQQWMFSTPKGEFRVQGKTVSPVWRKPDWAFVEEGLPVPPPYHPSRYEYGVLGDYALSLGHGYLIHGTLYQRFLGLPVTHGCIRMNDEDLEQVFTTLNVGSKVFIY
jgi:L,D-transpeptidase ErfK/SrfK